MKRLGKQQESIATPTGTYVFDRSYWPKVSAVELAMLDRLDPEWDLRVAAGAEMLAEDPPFMVSHWQETGDDIEIQCFVLSIGGDTTIATCTLLELLQRMIDDENDKWRPAAIANIRRTAQKMLELVGTDGPKET